MHFLNKHILLSLLLTSCGFVSEEESAELLQKNTTLGVEDIDGDGLENRVDSKPLIFNQVNICVRTPETLEILQEVKGDLDTFTIKHDIRNHKIESINRDRLSDYYNDRQAGYKVRDLLIQSIELFKLTQSDLRNLLVSKHRQFSNSEFSFSNKVSISLKGADGFSPEDLHFHLYQLKDEELNNLGEVRLAVDTCNPGTLKGLICNLEFKLDIDKDLLGVNDIYFYIAPAKMGVVRNGVKFDYVKKVNSVRGGLKRLVYLNGNKREVVNAVKQVTFQEMLREVEPKAEIREKGFVYLDYRSSNFNPELSPKDLLEQFKDKTRIQYENNNQTMIVRGIRANRLIQNKLKREKLNVSLNQDSNKFQVNPTTENDYIKLKISKMISKELDHYNEEIKTPCKYKSCYWTSLGDKCTLLDKEHIQNLYSISSELREKEADPTSFDIKVDGIKQSLTEATWSTFLGEHSVYLRNTKSFEPFTIELDLVRTFYDIGTYVQDDVIVPGCNPMPKPHKSKVETHRYLFEVALEGEQ